MLDNDKQARKDERERTLAERVPALQMSGLSLQDLQVRLSMTHFNPLVFLFLALKKVTIQSHYCLNTLKDHLKHFLQLVLV